MPTVLAILADGFEEIEATTPIDLLRRAGVEVTVAALGGDRAVTGRSGITLLADTTLDVVLSAPSHLSPSLFDCLFFPGGPGVKLLRADPRIRHVISAHAQAERWIAAICAAPTLLHDAGLLVNRRYTAHPSVAGELPAIQANERTVSDGRLLTSRGAGTSLDFGLLLIEKLVSLPAAQSVARAICA